jgi:hypothetical protein
MSTITIQVHLLKLQGDPSNLSIAKWSNNLRTTDKGLDMAASECAASHSCPLHELSGMKVRQRIERILASLLEQPVPVVNGSNYGIADYDLARYMLFRSLFSPVQLFPRVVQALADLEKGDGTKLFEVAQIKESLWRCSCARGGQFPPDKLFTDAGWETMAAIACGDGEPYDGDYEQLVEEYKKIASYSSFADVWPIRAYCR